MLAIVISLLRTAWRCWRIGLGHPELAPHGDIVIASTAFLLFVNTFEGFMFGVLTFFTVFIYAVFALSAYVSDAGAANEQRPEVTDDGPGWASISS
jgi:glucose dehydrogenase